ncbi:hypothetical protein [Parerythrobacter jejuensis]|uniref:Uncharacterized protein n=1 Tax=Parerythrobacter jejuensis TaxID=795812 RepID=A0A845AWQ9_9SPHN|nr:hypothetical protein [Parerythrobacter jejuensis]MXP31218.1 hypothetical protein [Parerythrobacter jejuensis]MXP33978.1 hypothetical protein [Parerythrobacter jejuensis]
MLERAITIGLKHERMIVIAAAIWFWAGIAIYARFIPLPDLPGWVRPTFFWSSVAFNAVWWGYVHGKVEARRRALAKPAAAPQETE